MPLAKRWSHHTGERQLQLRHVDSVPERPCDQPGGPRPGEANSGGLQGGAPKRPPENPMTAVCGEDVGPGLWMEREVIDPGLIPLLSI